MKSRTCSCSSSSNTRVICAYSSVESTLQQQHLIAYLCNLKKNKTKKTKKTEGGEIKRQQGKDDGTEQ